VARTAYQSLFQARQKFKLSILKSILGCQRCGYNEDPRALHFHHRDPEDKEFSLSWAGSSADARIQAEIEKCDVLCANCHAVVE
jgi:hypothetical protein